MMMARGHTFQLVQIAIMCVFLIPNHAQALPQGASNLSLSENERTEADKIRALLSKYTYTLERELATFHYQYADSPDSYRPASLDEIVKSAETWGTGFFNLDFFGNDMMGPGHYVAIDLTGSRSFGGTVDPQLYVTILKRNAKILDVRQNFDAGDKIFETARQVFGCLATNDTPNSPVEHYHPSGNSLGEWFPFFRTSSTVSCRKVIIQAVAELDIAAILYWYNASNELAGCRHDRTEALSIISPDAFDANQLAYFSNGKAFDPNHIGGSLKKLYEEGMQDSQSLPPEQSKMPLTLSALNSDGADYENWKANYIYKCGPEWKKERTDFSWSELIYEMKSREIAHLKFQLASAFSKKFQGSSNSGLDFQLMRGYNEMVYRFVGVTPDVWVAAIKRYNDYSDRDEIKKLRETAHILGETFNGDQGMFTTNSAVERAYNLFKQSQKEPNLAFAGFAQLGMGPRLTALVVNSFLMSVNGIPYVTGEFPLSKDRNYSALMETNRAAYISYLQGCLAQYANEQVSRDEIMAGPCGFIDTNKSN